MFSKRTYWIPALVVSVLALASLACGFSFGTPPATETPVPPPPTNTPVPTSTPLPTAIPEPEVVGSALEIVNQSADAVCYVYIAASGSTDWGPDQLGEANVIEAGGSFTITDIPAGTYELKADDCNGNTIAQQLEAKLGATPMTWTIGTTESAIKLINNSGVLLCSFFITESTSDTWGPNQLAEGEIVSTGDTYTITGIPPGTYDLRVESCDTDPLSAERTGVVVPPDFEWTITP